MNQRAEEWQRHAEAAAERIAALEARWAELKVRVDQIHARWQAVHSVAPVAVRNVQAVIAELESPQG